MGRKLYVYLFSFLFLVSCNGHSQQEYDRTFNFPLRKEISLQTVENNKEYHKIIERYLKIAEQEGYADGKAHCYINLAQLCINTGDFTKATLLLKDADDILKSSNNTALQAYLNNTLALLNYRVNITDSFALSYSTKAMQYMKKSSPEQQKIYEMDRIYLVRADFLSTTEKPDSAAFYIHKAIKSPSTELNLINSRASMAELKLYHFKMDSTDIYINKALEEIEKIKKKTGVHVYTYHIAGSYYSEIQQYKKAEDFFNKALAINHEISDNHFTPFLYTKVEELYRKNGNKEKEIYYTQLAQKAREQMFTYRSMGLNPVNRKLISDTGHEKQQELDKTWLYIGLLVLLLAAVSLLTHRRIKRLKLKREFLRDETFALRDEKEQLASQFHDKRLDEVMELARKNDSTFLSRFTDLYPHFISQLKTLNPDLEKSELIFCAMIKLNYSSKEIAQNMAIQHTSVQKRKSRLRKRLNIPSDVDIYDFFGQLNN